MNVLTVATRGGALAIAQTEMVISALKEVHPDIQVEIKRVTTSGDRDRRTTLWNLKDTGFFTSQVEDALLAGQADFAVHSFKDLPTAQREGLTITAVYDRQFVEDCLIAAEAVGSIEQLGASAKIGTSSLRRTAQLRHFRPDLEPVPVRGNVQTRIGLLDTGKVDAVVLARAGVFDPVEFRPAPAQGGLAVQTRIDDIPTNRLIAAIDDEKARIMTFAERHVLTTMQCGCHAPVGAFAKITADDIEIRAFISDLQGENFISRQITGQAANANKLAEQIAKELLEAGGREILEKTSGETAG